MYCIKVAGAAIKAFHIASNEGHLQGSVPDMVYRPASAARAAMCVA